MVSRWSTVRCCSLSRRRDRRESTEAVTPVRPSRKRARRDALFVLYQKEVTGEAIAVLLDKLRQREGYSPDPFTVRTVTEVSEGLARIDTQLSRFTRHWPLARIAPLERSALRLGFYELEQGLTPAEVAIDEAVRLVRRYSSDEAGALVNGILGAVLRDLQAKEEA